MEIKDIFEMEAMTVNGWQKKVDAMPNSPDLIQELLPYQQVLLLSGEREKAKKTNEGLHLFNKFQRGGRWHGLKVAPTPVLYITWEGHPKKINMRLVILSVQYYEQEVLYPGYFKMAKDRMCLDTQVGRDSLKKLIDKLNPKPQVTLLDPFNRTVSPGYSRIEVGQAWVEGVSEVARDIGSAIICTAHTNKLTHTKGKEEDAFSADKIKGCGNIPDGVNGIVMFGEERGSRRDKEIAEDGKEISVVRWSTFSGIIKVAKAKDSPAEFPMLRVHFDRDRLCWAGQEWSVNSNGTITVEDEI